MERRGVRVAFRENTISRSEDKPGSREARHRLACLPEAEKQLALQIAASSFVTDTAA